MPKGPDTFESPVESQITAQAVVVGCSHQNKDCDGLLHPATDFHTIDIDPKLKADTTLDIVKDPLPEALNNRFKLTVLECLPFSAYNTDKMYPHYGDGKEGWESIRKMTAPDGFILVVGNSRDLHCRTSLADLNYLEIGQLIEHPDVFILLVPNNQTINTAEVLKQMEALPAPLKKSINDAITTKGYKPFEPGDFCKLNYHVSSKNEKLIDTLNRYRNYFSNQPPEAGQFSLFGYRILGYTNQQKLDAITTLIAILIGNKELSAFAPYQPMLRYWPLSDIIGLQKISDLIDRSPPLADTSSTGKMFNLGVAAKAESSTAETPLSSSLQSKAENTEKQGVEPPQDEDANQDRPPFGP